MTMGRGVGILVEERVTVEHEGERKFVPEHSVQIHQPGILYILFIHVHYAVESGADHMRVKPGTLMAYREQRQVPVPRGVLLRVSSSSFVCLRG